MAESRREYVGIYCKILSNFQYSYKISITSPRHCRLIKNPIDFKRSDTKKVGENVMASNLKLGNNVRVK